MELVRLTRGQAAERFIKSAMSDENIGLLARFFADLTKIRSARKLIPNPPAAS
jgi:hypothetical protein